MIDYFKSKGGNVKATNIVDNKFLPFITKNVSDDGELFKSNKVNKDGTPIYRTPYKEAEYKGLTISYSENNNFRISGSIHKYWNDGKHNYNDFSVLNFKKSLNEFCNKFNLNPKECRLENLEIGINFTPPINTNDILDWCFLHSTKPFESKYDNEFGRYIQCVHSQYIIKIYNKALHYSAKGYKIDEEIMRFEIKFTVMEKLNKLGIYTLEDLLNFNFSRFKTIILKEWDKVFLFDSSLLDVKGFNQKYCNPIYWKELLKRESHSAYYKHRDKLNKITLKNSNNLKVIIKEIMSNKIDHLTNMGIYFERLPIISIPIPCVNDKIDKRICVVTGINISMQKEDSYLLSHKGLKQLFATDRKKYDEIKKKHLTPKWMDADFNTEIREIAHNIRNTKNNLNLKQKRLYPPNQIQMFTINC